MTDLLKASLFRLKKNKAFYVLMIINLFFIFISMLVLNFSMSYDNFNAFNYLVLDNMGNNILIVLAIILFIGNDFRNGSIRNKIIVGKSRKDIYLSNTITAIIISSIIYLSAMVEIILIGLIFFGVGSLTSTVFLNIIIGLFLNLTFASIYSLIAMLSNRANKGLLIGIIVYFATNIIITALFGISTMNNTLNKVIIFIFKIIPDGQAIIFSITEVNNWYYLLFSLTSIVYIALFTFIGIKAFNKLDLK